MGLPRHLPDAENQADLMVKQWTHDRLAIEVKKTRGCGRDSHLEAGARPVTNSTTKGLRYFCVTNGELLIIFRHEEGQRVAACMVADGRRSRALRPGGEADAVLDRWEEAITHLLPTSSSLAATDRTFAGLVEARRSARPLSLRLRHAVVPAYRSRAARGISGWCRTFPQPEDVENRATAAGGRAPPVTASSP